LAKNNYTQYNFERSDINCASYGGKASAKDVITRIPIVFIHGVSDIGYGQGSQDGHEV
jgi:triacylglycerol lipase